MRQFLIYFIAQVTAYLIGSMPFGYWIGWWKGGVDVRTMGSGNIGATNVGRILGFRYFLLVFVLDFLKGMVPVWLASADWLTAWLLRHDDELTGLSLLPAAVGIAAVLGHVFPIYLGCKGGKGIATTLGVVLVLLPIPAGVGLLGFCIVLLIARMVSLAALCFIALFAATYFLVTEAPFSSQQWLVSAMVVGITLLIFFRHWSNVQRIVRGAEPKVALFNKKN